MDGIATQLVFLAFACFVAGAWCHKMLSTDAARRQMTDAEFITEGQRRLKLSQEAVKAGQGLKTHA